jgi:hypothetical protein
MYDRKRIIHDMPIIQWILCVGLTGYGIYRFYLNPSVWIMPLILVGLGLLFLLINTVLNVYVDKSRRVLEIERLSVLGRKRIEVEMDKIERVYVDRRMSEDSDGDRSTTYQVILILDNGERVPLRKSYTGGRKKQYQYAELIASEVGIDRVDRAPESIREAVDMAFQMAPVENQEVKTGVAPGIQESDGVKWELQTFNFGNTAHESPVYRWSSMDVDTPTDFVFIVQRAEGAGQQKGLMKLAGNFLFKTTLKLYGFDESYTPGVERAKAVEDLDRRLVDSYYVFTNNPGVARQLINPWRVAPLIGWAERYELRTVNKNMHQLSVLFSPLGLYVSLIGKLDQAEIDELVSLGIELVKAD